MIVFLLFLFGLFIGSFLNVVVDRVTKGQSLLYPPSHCPHCHHRLSPLDLIPLVSFLLLGGKCRYCKKKISWYYPIIELATGVLFAMVILFIPVIGIMNQELAISNMIHLVFYLLTVSVLIAVFFADLKYGLIPFSVILPAIASTTLFLLLYSRSLIPNHVIAGISAAVFFYLLNLFGKKIFKQESMGFGDVIFAFYLGLLLGLPEIIFSLYLAFLTGGIVSLILILLGRKRLRGSTVPFGPFLVLGALIVLFGGDKLLTLFLRYTGYGLL